MRVLIFVLLAAISYAQTATDSGAAPSGGDTGTPARQQSADCWPWWCYPSAEAAGDNADSDICKIWILHAIARGCSPYAGMSAWQQYMYNPMFPVGPVMGPGMPIQGFQPQPEQAADTGIPAAPTSSVQNQMAFNYMMRDGDERSVMNQMMGGMQGMQQYGMGTMQQTGDVAQQYAGRQPTIYDTARMFGQDVEMPERDVEMPEQDVEGMYPGYGNPYARQAMNNGMQKLQKEVVPEKKAEMQEEQPEPMLRHHNPHTQKVLKAVHLEEEWNNTGMWFGLSFLFLILGAFAGYSIMNYLQKRQAMSCWASYGWDIPLTSRTDTV